MVRELLAQIEPVSLTASPHATPARWRRRLWLIAALAALAIFFVVEHVLDLPKVSSLVSSGIAWLFVAWIAYMALAGKLGDETTRWQTSAIFIVVTVGVGYTLYLSRHGQEPALDPGSLMMAVILGSCAASVFADSVTRERGEKWRDTALQRLRTPASNAFEACLSFPSIGGVVWAIDPTRRVLRAIVPGVADGDRSIVWDEPIRAVEIRRARRVGWSSNAFDCDLLIRSGSDSASEWTYVFEFPGPYREIATRWHKVFEDWMIEDQRRMMA